MRNIEKVLNGFGIVPGYYIARIADAYRECSCIEGIDRWCRKLAGIGTGRKPSELEAQIRSYCFELEVISNLCRHQSVSNIIYEPTAIDSRGKNCDLLVCSEAGDYFVEVKSFNPECSSRQLDYAYFSKNHIVDLDSITYYHDFSIRGRLIELAVEVEQKFANYRIKGRTVLAAQTGFHLDWIRYFGFVHIYKFGHSSILDYLGEMSIHFINNSSIRYKDMIDEFWSFRCTDNGIDEVSLVDASQCMPQAIKLSIK